MAFNVLFVDDSAIARSMVRKAVGEAGVDVGELYEAENGHEALNLLRDRWVDLVFVDVNMPIMGGEELVDAMRDDPVLGEIPVVLLTSEGCSPRIERLRARGVRAYLQKPCAPDAITAVVDQLLGCADPGSPADLAIRLLRDVMQNMAYLACEHPDAAPVDPEPPLFEGRIAFTGPLRGTFRILVPERLCLVLARRMLGGARGEASSGRLRSDALTEVLNVTCGHLLGALGGEASSQEKSLPEFRERPVSDWRAAVGLPSARGLTVEGLPVLGILEVEGRQR